MRLLRAFIRWKLGDRALQEELMTDDELLTSDGGEEEVTISDAEEDLKVHNLRRNEEERKKQEEKDINDNEGDYTGRGLKQKKRGMMWKPLETETSGNYKKKGIQGLKEEEMQTICQVTLVNVPIATMKTNSRYEI